MERAGVLVLHLTLATHPRHCISAGIISTYKSRVHKSHRGLPSLEPLVVDAGQDGGEHRGRCAGAANQGRGAFVEDHDVVADGGDVGVAAAGAVVYGR
jgi:hypothetical protein